MQPALFILLASLNAAPPFAALFENAASPPDASMTLVRTEAGVRVYEYSFASPVDGRVPAWLLTPERPGRYPLILFGHWMMDGSPLRNRDELLAEAILLARAGAICLLADTPLVRPGFRPDPDLLHGQEAHAALQMAREWRRALDLMLARPDVDARRVAYVGHSFSAGVGAKLTAIEKRIGSFVLMANTYSLRDFVYDPANAELVAFRRQAGEEQVARYLAAFPWDDSLPYVRHSAPAAVLLQNGRRDASIPVAVVRRSFTEFARPKRLKFYDAGHALDARARRDRVEWLQQRLGLQSVDRGALDAILPLR